MKKSTKRILLSAGEASGDLHAANLVQKVKRLNPHITFYGIGGDLMRKEGVNILVDVNNLSIIGFLEIITKFTQIRQAFRIMVNKLLRDKPDLLILVDYPGFNLRLAKVAKKLGVRVLYFISPKIWAWHQSRAKIVKKYVDVMAVIFPFEVDFYKQWQVPAIFVGNPLLKMVTTKLTPPAARRALNLKPNSQVIGLFPGSRIRELKYLLPTMLATTELLAKQNPNIEFLLPQAHSITDAELQKYLSTNSRKIHVIKQRNYEVMQACDAIIAASGTVTLEIALMGIPLVITYKTSWLEYQIAKLLLKIPYIGLCNILAKQEIAPEILQNDATAKNIAKEIQQILQDPTYRNNMLTHSQKIKDLLSQNVQITIEQLVIKMLNKKIMPYAAAIQAKK